MKKLPFIKFHGFGNDYIVVERASLVGADVSAFAKAMCCRHTGAGADGIAVIERSMNDAADFECEIVNPDGSIAGFSGNGTRCAVSYIYHRSLWSQPNLKLRTRSGIKNYELLERVSDGAFIFKAEIGTPQFTAAAVPFGNDAGSYEVIDRAVTTSAGEFLVSAVNVGNPAACIFVDDLEFDWRTPGRELESHTAFPERANIVFVRVDDDRNITIKIWERGAGETSSSGTCSSAAAVLAAKTGRTGRSVNVHADGGTTEIEWRADNEIVITGRADLSYFGEWPLSN